MVGVSKYAPKKAHWRVTISLGTDTDGKPDRKQFVICPPSCDGRCSQWPRYRARSRTDAQEVAKRIEKKILKANRPGGVTVADVASRWMDSKKRLAAKTRYDYQRDIDRYIVPRFGDLMPTDIRVADIRDWMEEFADDGKPVAGEHVLTVLRGVMRRAVEEDLIEHNPAREVSRPTQGRKLVKIPTDENVAVWVRAAVSDGQPWTASFLLTAAETGARKGELCALRWQDVDLDAKQIRIAHAIDFEGTLKDTKTHNVRIVPLTDKAVETLTAWAAITAEAGREDAGLDLRDPMPDWYVWASPRGGMTVPIRPDVVTKSTIKLRQKLERLHAAEKIEADEVPKPMGIHHLRHYFASRIYQRTKDSLVTAELLGHADASMIEKVYGHVIEGDTAKAVALLNSPAELGTSSN